MVPWTQIRENVKNKGVENWNAEKLSRMRAEKYLFYLAV